MRLTFELPDWVDTYDIDRWGNVRAVVGPLGLKSEYRLPIAGINEMLDQYFRNCSGNGPVKASLEWPSEVDPVEVAVFLGAQMRAELVYPAYRPVPEHQPRRQ